MSESDAECAVKPTVPWQRFCELVRPRQRFVLTSHVRPDCDALGSELAMAAILESLGKDVLICNAFAVPPNLRFLDPTKRMQAVRRRRAARTNSQGREVLMVLDTSAWAQLGAMADVIRNTNGVKVVLDHHVSGGRPGGRAVQGHRGRGHRPAGGRGGRPAGRAAHARDRPAGLRRPGHRHRLVPLRLDHGRARCGWPRRLVEAGAVPDQTLQANSTRTTRSPGCS